MFMVTHNMLYNIIHMIRVIETFKQTEQNKDKK